MEPLNVLRRDPASKGAARSLFVICHGVGADGHDVFPLCEVLAQAVPDAAFLVPDAPEPCDMAPMGRQWFSLRDRTPAVLEAGARRATPALLAAIAAELERLGLAQDAVAMMGFSQGAMMVLFAGLRRTPPPRAILAYSGALLETPALEREVVGHPPTLLVHGEADDVVPFAHGPAAEAALRRLGIPLTTLWQPRVGHWIDDAGVAAGALFLQQVFCGVTGT